MSEHVWRDWVWVVQVEDYDNQPVVAVARTLDAAVAALKARYPATCAVEWSSAKPVVFDEDPVEETPSWYNITARFEARPGYSTAHTANWDIRRHYLA